MPDMDMCLNHNCPSTKLCYRHEAKPSEPYQWYGAFAPDETNICPNFIVMTVMLPPLSNQMMSEADTGQPEN